jgi:hypothetical protein
MSDSETPPTPFRYHLELTPPQLKITHTALHSLLDDLGHEEAEVLEIVREVLAKLPDEHAIRAIRLGNEHAPHIESAEADEGEIDGPPDSVA